MGVKIIELLDGLEIIGGVFIIGIDVESNGDYRVVMSLAIVVLNVIGIINIYYVEIVNIFYFSFV